MPEWLRRLIERAREIWRGMTPARRVAVVILSLLLLVALFLFIPTAIPRERFVVLVPAEENPDVKAQVKKILDEKGYRYQIKNEAIWVRDFEKDKITMELAGAFTDVEIFKFVFETDFAATQWQREKRWQVALQRKLQRMVSSIDAVRNAYVTITPASEARTLGFQGEQAKASVIVDLHLGKRLTKQNVIAIANLVAGSLRDLKPHKVNIMDTTGRYYRVPDPKESYTMAQDLMDIQAEAERRLEEKVRKVLFPFYGDNVFVAATVILDPRKVHEESETRAAEPTFLKEKKEETKKTTEVIKGGPATIKPPLGEMTSKITTDEKKIHTKNLTTQRIIKITDIPPGVSITKVSIAVMIPYYLAGGSSHLSNPHPKPIFQEEKFKETKKEVVDAVSKATGILEDDITVRAFPVRKPKIEVKEPTTEERLISFLLRYGWFIVALPLFAIIAYIIFRLARKPAPKPEVPEEVPEEKEAEEIAKKIPKIRLELGDRPRVLGIKQAVEDMSSKNPKMIAAVLKRWLSIR
jgi:flagellar M-ring protein FliF